MVKCSVDIVLYRIRRSPMLTTKLFGSVRSVCNSSGDLHACVLSMQQDAVAKVAALMHS